MSSKSTVKILVQKHMKYIKTIRCNLYVHGNIYKQYPISTVQNNCIY